MSKFYIYAGGRWCEVETRRGRVEGFRERARFCYVRGGRLHAARTAAVLRALRALAAGEPGAARDSAPLPQRYRRPRRRSRRARPSAHTHHCCAHLHAGCQGVVNILPPPVTPVTPILAAPPQSTDPQRKRRRISSSEGPANSLVRPTTPLKRQKINAEKAKDSSEEEPLLTTKVMRQKTQREVVVESSASRESENVPQKSPTKQKAPTHVVDSSSDDDDQAQRRLRSENTSPKKGIVNLEVSSDRDNSKPVRSPLKHHSRVTRLNVAKRDAQVVDSSSDAESKKPVRAPKKPQSLKEASVVTDADKLVQMLLESSSEASSSSSQSNATQPRKRCKELLIGESDVSALRRYLARSGSSRATLSRFDNDERYKVRIFHRLNPLVTLERCQPLENLLRQRVTLKEFAKNLGLRSVADVTPEKRYKMRNSARNASVPNDSGTDKENAVKPKKRKLWNNDKALFSARSSRSSELRPKITKPALRDSSKDTSDSDTEFKRRVREQLKKKPIVTRRESYTDIVRRRTRSAGKPSEPTSKPFTNSVAVNPVDGPRQGNTAEVRQTRQSGRFTAKPSNIEPQEVVNLKLARVEDSEWEVVSKQASSSTAIPARTLKEQNNDSDNAFKPSKNSPKKANLIRKGKHAVDTDSMFKRIDGGKVTDGNSQKSEATSKVVRSMDKPVKLKKSCVTNGRQYTPLEDQAIVAWVSVGGRERLVNGNRLWREFALQYHRITGQSRSWHSLRNRYLRYVLPALGTLALEPAHAARLRAAAAAGEIKSKSSQQRRNSMFAAPAVRSASARRAAPAPAPASPRRSSTPPASPRRSSTPPTSPRRPRTPPASPPPARRTRSSGGPSRAPKHEA